MAKTTKIVTPFSLNVEIVPQHEGGIPNNPNLDVIFQANSKTPALLTANNSYFYDNLSKVEKIIPKEQPPSIGNIAFLTDNIITCKLYGDDNKKLFLPKVMESIDMGKKQTTTSAIASEIHIMSNQPRSGVNYNTWVTRSSLSAFEMPQCSPRGTRKIPTSSVDTVCCKSGYTYDRINYNWLFGNNAGVTFDPIKRGATPISITGSVVSQEGCAAISNEKGELLFYTDGNTVYTSGNTIMTMGFDLSSSGTSTQSALIVPQPGNRKYYIFTTDYAEHPNGFEYSMVDYTNPLFPEGIVLPKNIELIPGAVSEKVTGCNHANCEDFWVITHTSGDSSFYTYRITSTGIVPGPITSIGSIHNTARGYMKTSIDGNRLVSLLYDEDIIDIFDFDKNSGVISNFITVTGFTYDIGPYGLEFSSDSTKIYISDGAGEKINQFDITYTSTTDIVSYAIEIASISGASLGALQMGADEKIYVADRNSPYLHVIHYPNGLGLQCNFQENNFSLTGASTAHTSDWGLPNVITTKVFSCDRYKYVSSPSRGDWDFDFVFNDASNVIQSKKLNCNIKIYPYNTTVNQFEPTPLGEFDVSYQELSSTTTTTISIPPDTMGEGERLFKFYFNYPTPTLLSGKLGIISNTFPGAERGTEYLLYDRRTDWYCFNMLEAQKPQFAQDIETASPFSSNLYVESTITDGIHNTYGIVTLSSCMVALNGIVQTIDVDYVLNLTGATQFVELTFMPLANQIITVAYVRDGSSDDLFVDAFKITTPIISGPLGGQGSARVYKNTDKNTFEVYQLIQPLGGSILVVNGEMLGIGFDYLYSSSDTKRLIVLDELKVGDDIEMIYVPRTGVYGVVSTNKPAISWYIENGPITGFYGEFILQAAASDDPDFTNILFSVVVPHVVGDRSYSGVLDLSFASAGDEFYYRVLNRKWYVTIEGLIIRDETSSDIIGKIEITSNYGDVY